MDQPTTSPTDAAELQVEQAQSRLAAYAALASAAAILIAVGLYVMAMKDADMRSKAALLTAIHDHSTQLILSSLFRTLSFALLAIVLGFLALAAKRRMPMLPGLTVPVAYAGPALLAVTAPITVLAQINAAKTFVNGPVQSVKAAEAALGGGFVTASQYLSVFAVMLLAVAWIVVGLYCMKSGLLTRLVGGVAIAIGVLTVISVYGPSVLALVIEFFWLAAVAVMLLADDQTRPPAWKLGVAVPWREVDAARSAAEASTEDPKPQD
jgi:hypothetical protein